MTSIRTLGPAAAAAFALALAGCGGGGGEKQGEDQAMVPPPDRTPELPPDRTPEPPSDRTPEPTPGTQIAGTPEQALALQSVLEGHLAGVGPAGTDPKPGTLPFDRMTTGMPDDDIGIYDVDVNRIGPNNVPTVTLMENVADGADPARAFSAAGVVAPVSDTGWTGRAFMRTVEKHGVTGCTTAAPCDGEEYAVVYTDIEAAKDEKFSEWYEARAAKFAVVNVVGGKLRLRRSVSDIDQREVLEAARAGVYGETFGMLGPDASESYAKDRALPGTFHDVAGTYQCVGDDGCAVKTGHAGLVESLTGIWEFTPHDPDAMASGARPDDDFLHFGYWLETLTTPAGPVYRVQTFAHGSKAYKETTAIGELQGTVTYVGPAAGVFMQVTAQEGATVTAATTGHFTADVSLTANFDSYGDDIAADSEKFTIFGTVGDFMDDAGNDLGWSVMLQAADFSGRSSDSAGPGTTYESSFEGRTVDAQGARFGTWKGMFYGDDDADARGNYPHPTGVAGEFNARFANGIAVGAYGAERQQ